MMKKEEFFNHIGTINRYALLDRMRMDCEYWLGAGNRCNKHLWGGYPDDQIQYMTWLYESFSDAEKPEWMSIDLIKYYNSLMQVNIKDYKNEYFDIVSKYAGYYGEDFMKTDINRRIVYNRAAEEFIRKHGEKTFHKISEGWK